MTSDQKENLFVLIKSLSKSEKRQFKLYAGRMGSNLDSKFLSLFSLLDKMDVYDEKIILKKDFVTKQQLSNLKAHLYRQILISLRLNPSQQNKRMQIREQLDCYGAVSKRFVQSKFEGFGSSKNHCCKV